MTYRIASNEWSGQLSDIHANTSSLTIDDGTDLASLEFPPIVEESNVGLLRWTRNPTRRCEALAFAMGANNRLGEYSHIRSLPRDVLSRIMQFLLRADKKEYTIYSLAHIKHKFHQAPSHWQLFTYDIRANYWALSACFGKNLADCSLVPLCGELYALGWLIDASHSFRWCIHKLDEDQWKHIFTDVENEMSWSANLLHVRCGRSLYLLDREVRMFLEFNPNATQIVTKRSKPQSRPSVMITCSGTIYLLGGLSNTMMEQYCPTADSWNLVKPMPKPRQNFVVKEVGGKLFVLGGFERREDQAGSNWCSSCPCLPLSYDPQTNTWVRLTTFQQPWTLMPHVLNTEGSLCIFGDTICEPGRDECIMEVYDPHKQTSMLIAHSFMHMCIDAFFVDGWIIAFDLFSNELWKLDARNFSTNSGLASQQWVLCAKAPYDDWEISNCHLDDSLV